MIRYRMIAILFAGLLLAWLVFSVWRSRHLAQEPITEWRYAYEDVPDTLNRSGLIAIGRLSFIRNKSIPDSLHYAVYGRRWHPLMTFDVLPHEMHDECLADQHEVHVLSSCTSPNVGGDIFSVGKFILYNNDVCLNCEHEDGVDRCRGPIGEIIERIQEQDPATISQLIEAVPVQKWRD